MLARVFSCAVIGLDGVIIEVEVDTNQGGLPMMIIVGLPDTSVQESRERVQSAIKNSGLEYPRKRITVNLAPASVRKEGPAYDLPIALGVLAANEQIPLEPLNSCLVIGELSLDGSVRHVSGILPMTAAARQEGYQSVIVPLCDAAEAALVPGIEVIPVGNLNDLHRHFNGIEPISSFPPYTLVREDPSTQTDFMEIKGQEHVKRALEVAAAGGHNVLMVGPPGSGKTLLARAIPAILPNLTIDEALDVTRIYSVADILAKDTPLIQTRPFRAPHHTISHAGLVGGGNWPRPGEVSLAHRGVLFLDELPEFGHRVLEVMRQPLEDKFVTISRAQGSLTFPANFQLIAAMNPCPCGYFGDPIKPCSCSNQTIQKYQKRISGPLLDRIDIHIEVPRIEYHKLSDHRLGEPSSEIQSRVENARKIQIKRLNCPDVVCNGEMRPEHIRQFCKLDELSEKMIRTAMAQMMLSARAYHRVLKLARTIADLAGSEQIQSPHLAEAIQYRNRLQEMT